MLELPIFKARIMALPLFCKMLLYYYNKKEIARGRLAPPFAIPSERKKYAVPNNQKTSPKFVKKSEKRC